MNALSIYRKKKNLTQSQLAALLGVTQGAIADIERGRRKVGALKSVQFEKATHGELSRESLRPDLFVHGS